MQRELQRSVTEIRRSRNARARGSSIGPGARAPARPGIGSGPRGWFNGITFVAMEELYSDPMADRPSQRISVILQREPVEGRWESHRWDLLGVVPDVGGEVRTMEEKGSLQRIFPGIEVTLFRDEAEGYYLNVSSEAPSVFVSLRLDEATSEPYPFQASLSYNEAARWMDSNERVERVLVWPELVEWMGQWVEANYRPEPKKRQKPRSFEGKEGRLRKEGA